MLIVGIVSPALVIGTASLRAEALSPGAEDFKAPVGKSPATPAVHAPSTQGNMEGSQRCAVMPPAIEQQCGVMMNTELSKDDASCLLAQKHDLKLNQEQIQLLQIILKESRQQAAALLTKAPAQWTPTER